MSNWALWICVIFFIGAGTAADVPFVFDETISNLTGYTPSQLEEVCVSSPDLVGIPTVTQVEDNETLDFPITGGGNAPIGSIERNVNDLKREFDAKVEPENSRVNEEATVLALKHPGDLTIDQIASIYNYLKNGEDSMKGWGYVRDPRGIDYVRYANETLKLGEKTNRSGGGDCDDFAIRTCLARSGRHQRTHLAASCEANSREQILSEIGYCYCFQSEIAYFLQAHHRMKPASIKLFRGAKHIPLF